DCDCTRCACWRSEQASAGSHRHGSISRLLDHWAVDRVVLGRLQRDGACAGHPTELWFPNGRGPSSDWDTPRAICDTCQVRADCLAFALERSIPHGMFGGLTPHERSKLTAAVAYTYAFSDSETVDDSPPEDDDLGDDSLFADDDPPTPPPEAQ